MNKKSKLNIDDFAKEVADSLISQLKLDLVKTRLCEDDYVAAVDNIMKTLSDKDYETLILYLKVMLDSYEKVWDQLVSATRHV